MKKIAICNFVAGAIAGSVIALLFAPRTGEETRKRLRDKVRLAREKSVEISKKAALKAKVFSEDAKKKIEVAKKFKEDHLQEIVKDTKDRWGKAKKASK